VATTMPIIPYSNFPTAGDRDPRKAVERGFPRSENGLAHHGLDTEDASTLPVSARGRSANLASLRGYVLVRRQRTVRTACQLDSAL
jgi:hypothetical protein